MMPLRVSLALRCVSMKSTTSLRPAMPPPPSLLLMYFAAPLTPSAAPLNKPGARALSTSARTAMWISFAVTPISVAFGVSLDDCATAGAIPSIATAVAHTPTSRIRPLRNIRVSPSCPAGYRAVAYCIHGASCGWRRARRSQHDPPVTSPDPTVQDRLDALGIVLPGPYPPHDPLDAVVIHGGRARTSGQLPRG